MVKKKCGDSPDAPGSVSTGNELQRISLTFQCSAAKSRWTAKWTSLCLFSKQGKPGSTAVSATLRLKFPRAALKLSLAAGSSVRGKGRFSAALHKTVTFFGLLKTRKVCLRLRGYLRKLKDKAFLPARCDSGEGQVPDGDYGCAQRRKVVELEDWERQPLPFDKSFSGRQTGSLLGPLTGLASVKERWGMAVQGVVISALMLLGQLVIAGAVSSAAFTATASVFVIGLVLYSFRGSNKLSTALWKVWREAIRYGSVSVSPQPSWTVVEPFVSSQVLSALQFLSTAFESSVRSRMLSGVPFAISVLSLVLLFHNVLIG